MSIPVVCDTMVFFQWAARKSGNHAIFRAVHEGQATLCLSHELLAEITDVLSRPATRRKFPTLSTEAVSEFIADVGSCGQVFDPVPRRFTWPAHPDDDHVFNLAICAKANYLVTWETRILNFAAESHPSAILFHRLAPDLKIASPKQWAEILRLHYQDPQV